MKTVDVRADIPLLEDFIYLDAASTTPTPRPVVEAMSNYYYHYNANTGRGAYRLAVRATQEMERAREKVAGFIKASALEIIFTKNTTEAINLVARGINFRKGDRIVVSNMEHHSNLVPWLNLKKRGVEVEIVNADVEGVIEPSDIEKAINKDTKLLTITHISNSIGSVLNMDGFQLTQCPNRFEGGTQNIAGYIGLGAAVDYVDRIGIRKIEKHDRKLTQILYRELNNLEGANVYGSPENIYGIVSFNIDGMNPHDLAKILDETKNICVRSGQHCAIPSIKHMGVREAGGTVRASFHYYNTIEEVKVLIECLEEVSSLWR